MAKKPELDQQIAFPKNWKNLNLEELKKWLNENYLPKPRITTEVKRRKKPHDKFKLRMQVDSTPVELNVEADKTNVELKNLTPNPYKHSFGKVRFPNGVAEACIYLDKNNLQEMPNSVLWYFTKDDFAKGKGFVSDNRRAKEFYSLQSKIRYFLSLSAERKREYLQRKGVFANIYTLGNNNNEAKN